MARIQIPIDMLTSRLNLSDRFASMRSGSIASRFSNLRPISEFFDFKRLSKPANFAETQSRVNYNLGHFSSNYAVVFVMFFIYSMLTNLPLLLDILFVMGSMFLIGKLDGRDLELGQQRFTTSQLYTGVCIIAIPVALWSSPFATMLWLIGASGATILAPQWGRPSRRERRKRAARNESEEEEERWWDNGRRVVEEVETDDSDTQGVGLASNALGKRIASDPLEFTGIDLGDRSGGSRPRRNYAYQQDGDSTSDEDSARESGGSRHSQRLSLLEREEALADSVMARIRRAQAKGKTDVKLSKEELEAYERRRRRIEDEERRKRRETRIAIPISQLEPAPRKKRHSIVGDSPPQQYSPGDEGLQRPLPPMGYFPPPSSSRAPRPRSGTASSRPPSRTAVDREQSSSPFSYSYVNADHASSLRHSSDPVLGRPSSRNSQSRRDSLLSTHQSLATATSGVSASSMPDASRQPQGAVDPFQFMTTGPNSPYHAGATATRRTVMSPPVGYGARTSPPGGGPVASRTRQHQQESSDEDTSSEESSESEGAKIVQRPGSRTVNTGSANQGRGRESVIVTERRPEPEQERPPSREATPPPPSRPSPPAVQSPPRRKAVGGASNSARRRRGR
ncbi:putative COPII vesicles protein Yip3 [Podospora didyma]|uniref:COPII vesicles protein Yip3 n=1 Tax=Podospora didyma TaxID=330526 RepID=A0AAE0U767_9PEZI|nr:putative COPII vesicles protein Yip3 [Podospora didyma]